MKRQEKISMKDFALRRLAAYLVAVLLAGIVSTLQANGHHVGHVAVFP